MGIMGNDQRYAGEGKGEGNRWNIWNGWNY